MLLGKFNDVVCTHRYLNPLPKTDSDENVRMRHDIFGEKWDRAKKKERQKMKIFNQIAQKEFEECNEQKSSWKNQHTAKMKCQRDNLIITY